MAIETWAKFFEKCFEAMGFYNYPYFAERQCVNESSSVAHPSTMTNGTYVTSHCLDIEEYKFRQTLNIIFLSGYSSSLVAVIVAICIFISLRGLACLRVSIHVQMLLSFACTSIVLCAWNLSVANNIAVITENPVWCQMMYIITKYNMFANYTWMFGQSVQLYQAVQHVFRKETLTPYALSCWGVPLVIMVFYTVYRISQDGSTDMCWMDNSYTAAWVISGSVMITLLLSFVLLINTLVVVYKQHESRTNRKCIVYWKVVRALLILMPLCGIHFLLLPWQPETGTYYDHAYQIFNAVITSFQGLIVSTLFCFTNGDVLTALRRVIARYRRIRSMRTGNDIYAVQKNNIRMCRVSPSSI